MSDTVAKGKADAQRLADAVSARRIESSWLINVGRLGWIAKGVVYALIGALAVPIALRESSGGDGKATRQGAIAKIADSSSGEVLLILLAVGLALYALWRLTTAILPGNDSELETWANRAGYFGSAAIYAFLAWSAVSFLTSGGSGAGSGGGSGGQSTVEKFTRTLMESTGGRWLLCIGAIGAIGLACYFAYKGVKAEFMEQIDTSGAGQSEREIIEKLGTIGWIGRGVTLALLAVFVFNASITADPDEAKGLDEALRETAEKSWGAILVLIAGLGLIAYGVFAVISARRQVMIGP